MSGQKLQSKQNNNPLVKLLMLGESSVGKTSLLIRYMDNKFQNNTHLTIGIDGKNVNRKINGRNIKLQFWDTAGQEKFSTIPSNYYRGVHGIILVYDITNNDTFQRVQNWLEKIEQNSNCNSMILMLVGNKLDLKIKRQVPMEEANQFALSKGMKFKQTSAKDDINVQEMVTDITMSILQKGVIPSQVPNLQLKNNQKQQQDSNCC